MFGLNVIFKLIKIFHSKEEPHHIALGFALGSIIGLTPFWSLHNLLVFILILLLEVSIPAAFFGIFFFSCFAHLCDPFFHHLGYFLLVEVEFLKPVWTYLYNIPVAPLTKFYNTVVLGSLISSLVAFFPVYFGFKQMVKFYQAKVAEKASRLKIVQILKANKIFQMYRKIKMQ
ncbi:MAG TPA: TIGR03546 family protein [Firmicutes bacterium]|nr:TIGR03546 family protein [Bacillota bacterium]